MEATIDGLAGDFAANRGVVDQLKMSGVHDLDADDSTSAVLAAWPGLGQLGDGSTTSSGTPVKVCGLKNAVAVAGGYKLSLALLADGTVWAWGYRDLGQLGNGPATVSHTPVAVPNLSGVKAIAAGAGHSVALQRAGNTSERPGRLMGDGTVSAWGDNDYGELGNGNNTRTQAPVKVSNLSQVKAISAGAFHTLGCQ